MGVLAKQYFPHAPIAAPLRGPQSLDASSLASGTCMHETTPPKPGWLPIRSSYQVINPRPDESALSICSLLSSVKFSTQ